MDSLKKENEFSHFMNLILADQDANNIIINSIMRSMDYTCVKLVTTEAYSLYKIRRNLMAKNDDQRAQFDLVLNNLLQHRENAVKLHMVIFREVAFLLFTDEDIKTSLGYITLTK